LVTQSKREAPLTDIEIQEIPPDSYLEEITRCSVDPWYWLINYVRISDPVKGNIRFEDWPHMQHLLNATFSQDRIIVLKARQIGVSWFYAAIAEWYARFRKNATVVVISKDGTASSRFKWRCDFINRNMPEWMQLPVGRNNDTEFEFPDNDSRILSFAAGEEAGRSESATVVILDEWAFQEYARTIYTAILPTVEQGKLIGISTANGKGNLFYEIWEKASLGQNSYLPIFIKYNVRPGRTREWWNAALKDAESPGKHRQEYPLTVADAFAVIQEPYFDIDALHRMPIEPGSTMGDYSYIYHEYDPEESYSAGIDPAPGGSDSAVLHILDSMGQQVAVCKTNEGLDKFSDEAYRLLVRYGTPFCIIEKQGEGTSIIRSFQANVDLKGSPRTPYPTHRLYKTSEKNYGWHTNNNNRDLILGQLRTAIRNGDVVVHHQETLDELAGFGTNPKTGKLEGLYGHDDTVISLALAYEAGRSVVPQIPRENLEGKDYVSFGQVTSFDFDPRLWDKRNPFECYVQVQRRVDSPTERCGINHNTYQEMLDCHHNQ
jgi:hypothetical protein